MNDKTQNQEGQNQNQSQENNQGGENQNQNQNQSATQTQAQKEAQVLDSKAGEMFSKTSEQNKKAEEQKQEGESGQKKEEKPNQDLVVNGKKFANMEQLNNYLALLEERSNKKTQEEETRKDTVEYQIKERAKKGELDEDFINKMYDNPKEFVKELQQQVYSTIEEKEQIKNNQKQFWDNFYGQNPELQNKQRAVQMVMQEQWDKVKGMTTDEAQKYLCKEVKSFIYETTGQKIETQVESKDNAVYTGSGGSPQGASKPENKGNETNFLEEIKNLRKRRA